MSFIEQFSNIWQETPLRSQNHWICRIRFKSVPYVSAFVGGSSWPSSSRPVLRSVNLIMFDSFYALRLRTWCSWDCVCLIWTSQFWTLKVTIAATKSSFFGSLFFSNLITRSVTPTVWRCCWQFGWTREHVLSRFKPLNFVWVASQMMLSTAVFGVALRASV